MIAHYIMISRRGPAENAGLPVSRQTGVLGVSTTVGVKSGVMSDPGDGKYSIITPENTKLWSQTLN